MEKFPHNVKCKTEFFPFDKTFYRREPPHMVVKKWPNKVESNQKNSKKIYMSSNKSAVLLHFVKKLILKRVNTPKPQVHSSYTKVKNLLTE